MNRTVCSIVLVMVMVMVVVMNMTASGQGRTGQPWQVVTAGHATIYYTNMDASIVGPVSSMLNAGEGKVAEFFGGPFDSAFAVYIYPDRKSLDKQWQQAWGDTSFHSECWMVASGVADRLDLVSPRIWATEHCEHNFGDSAASSALLAHELVHVYQGQHNPRKQFDGLDSLAWYLEGLATYASGQLDEKRMKGVKALLDAGKGPDKLGTFWTGQAKYGNAGSLVAYIDKKYGRKMLFDLLPQTDQRVMLHLLGTTEEYLIQGWRKSLPSVFRMPIHR